MHAKATMQLHMLCDTKLWLQTGTLPEEWSRNIANSTNTLDVHGEDMMLEGTIPQSWQGQ